MVPATPADSQIGRPPEVRRHWYAWLVVGVVFLSQVGACVDLLGLKHHRSGGLFYMNSPSLTTIVVWPLTEEAAAALEDYEKPVQLLAINGQVVADYGRPLHLDDLIDTRQGAKNRFALGSRDGRSFVVELTAKTPDTRVFVGKTVVGLLYHLAGLLYLAVGLLVWWRRPTDRAAWPLLALGAVACLQLTFVVPHTATGQLLTVVKLGTFALWGVAGLFFSVRFMGCDGQRPARIMQQIALALALLTGAGGAVGLVLPSLSLLRVAFFATGVLLLVCVVLMALMSWMESRGPRPLALKRRARVLTGAFLVSFLFPSVIVVLQSVTSLFSALLGLLNLLALAAFPLIIGYAIIRHQLFDLRIVLRRSMVYGALSLLVSIGYVGVVLLFVKLARHSPSPLFIGVTVAVSVVIFGLVHVRVQRVVDRFVFRSRYVYADAVARASATLTLDRNIETVRDTVKGALCDAMGLSRVYLLLWDPPDRHEQLRCDAIGAQKPRCADAVEGAPMPPRLDPKAFAPILRALRTHTLVSTHDVAAVAAQSGGDIDNEHREAGFWGHFGLEAVIPLTVGAETSVSRVVGLLLLGPKCSGRPLDSEDHALLITLANQLAVAIEGVNALTEVQRLNDELEQRVADRTRELSQALDGLKEAERQLIETKTQAALTRVVAGILHEVNSPLGTMRSSVDSLDRVFDRCQPVIEPLAKDGQLQAASALSALGRGKDLAQVARDSAERIGGVMDSLQRFVSLDEADVKLLDVKRGIADVQTLLQPSFGDRIALRVDVDEAPTFVRGNPAKLNRVFLNLLQNAINAINESGEVQVEVRRQDGQVVLDVSDDGAGIAAGRIDDLFDVGFTTKKDGRVGLRLGLPSAKRWVEEAGGTLRIESTEGKGTRVRVVLPAADARAA